MTRRDQLFWAGIVAALLVVYVCGCLVPEVMREFSKSVSLVPPVAEAADDVKELDAEVVAEGHYWYRSGLVRLQVLLVNNNTPCLAQEGYIKTCDFENGLESPLLDGFR